MNKIRKFIGNVLLIGAIICFALFMTTKNHELKSTLAMCYGIGIIGGGALRIGDFFKWRAKKHQEGVEEAMKKYSRFCPHCGKGLNADTTFCPHCGEKL